ncbi:S-layer homology domain-containing protein [Chryseomicrobium palamuruense]|uniref:S-layer homology domain-containing protein n=1 Tax=Chryseomicrobium palamuruense TaxID=682973 RepID=A0ABV8UUT1_9BACL
MKKLLFSTVLAGSLLLSSSAFANTSEFTDVPTSHQFSKHIQYLVNEGVISGYKDGRFGLLENLTRGQAALMIARAFDLDTSARETVFTDVNSNYAGAVQSGFEVGIIQGTSPTTFAPEKNITRAEMALMLARAFKLEEESSKEFSDVPMSKKGYSEIRKIHAFGITGGIDANRFEPDWNLKRGEFSAFLARALNAELRLKSATCEYDDSRVTNPSRQALNCLVTNAARSADGIIPPEIVKGIINEEMGNWQHFDNNGKAIVSDDGGIGLTQITNTVGYDVEKLKTSIQYNVETAIDMLLYHFNRSDLPKVGNHDPNNLESWYFAVMAYNGTKPVNSPFVKATGAVNPNAYQERVYDEINTSSYVPTSIRSIGMTSDDFTYASGSAENIVFEEKQFILNAEATHSRDRYKAEDQAILLNSRLRDKPTTVNSTVINAAAGSTVRILGAPLYDQNVHAKHNFVWYPVEVVIDGKKQYLYVSSQNLK